MSNDFYLHRQKVRDAVDDLSYIDRDCKCKKTKVDSPYGEKSLEKIEICQKFDHVIGLLKCLALTQIPDDPETYLIDEITSRLEKLKMDIENE